MKNILLLAVFSLLILSCGTSKSTSDAKETVTDSKKVIEGDWSLDTINYSDEGDYLISIFNESSKECFEGSSWSFDPGNNSGTFTINKKDCPNGKRTFRYIAQESDPSTGLFDFFLKLTGEKYKSDISSGSRLHVSKLTDLYMSWEQTATLEGEDITIKMNFSKK